MKRILMRGALLASVALSTLLAQPKPKSQEEVDALKAMFSAQTADARIAAAENVLTKFADSEFKPEALYFEAESYKQKGDYEKAIVFGERTLEADPKHFRAMLMLATLIAAHTKEFDLDREEKLGQVEKYAHGVMEIAKTATKTNPSMSDADWAAAMKNLTADAHAALGMAGMVRKKYDAAEAEFKLSVDGADKPDPSNIVRLGRAYMADGKYDDAIAQFDRVMAMQDINVVVRQSAQADRVRAFEKKKAAAGPAAATPAPAAPPQPATPKP